MYPPELLNLMQEDLTKLGFNELTTSSEVKQMIDSNGDRLLLVLISVCGCAAGNMRPGVKPSLNNDKKPITLATVFAGVNGEVCAQVGKHLLPQCPSSPSIALFKDGKLIHYLVRHHIEGGTAQMIAKKSFRSFLAKNRYLFFVFPFTQVSNLARFKTKKTSTLRG